MFVMDSIKIIGKITLPDAPVKHKCVCDDCGDVLNDSCGDPRHKVSTYSDKYAVNPTAVRWICDICADEQFGDYEPYSIFDGTPDWMIYCY
jgi:hypothetical protein